MSDLYSTGALLTTGAAVIGVSAAAYYFGVNGGPPKGNDGLLTKPYLMNQSVVVRKENEKGETGVYRNAMFQVQIFEQSPPADLFPVERRTIESLI